jgi:hypothetical protein
MTMDYGFGPEDVPPSTYLPPPCKGKPGGHYFTRDRSQPDDRQWTCRVCGDVDPVQPGVDGPTPTGWPK